MRPVRNAIAYITGLFGRCMLTLFPCGWSAALNPINSRRSLAAPGAEDSEFIAHRKYNHPKHAWRQVRLDIEGLDWKMLCRNVAMSRLNYLLLLSATAGAATVRAIGRSRGRSVGQAAWLNNMTDCTGARERPVRPHGRLRRLTPESGLACHQKIGRAEIRTDPCRSRRPSTTRRSPCRRRGRCRSRGH